MGTSYRLVPAWLLDSMRERKISELIVQWVSSFISNRTTIICLPGYNTDAFLTHTGIPQGLPQSLIFILFYNANLVDACSIPTVPTSGMGFVDNVNALAFSKTTEDNCITLRSVNECCLEGAKRHGASFASEKYILVHFTKARTKHNTSCLLTFPPFTISPNLSARVFGVILNK
jgi:hypothetical protein